MEMNLQTLYILWKPQKLYHVSADAWYIAGQLSYSVVKFHSYSTVGDNGARHYLHTSKFNVMVKMTIIFENLGNGPWN